jgi:hypothetical protein
MSILERLSSALGERTNSANVALAEDIVRTRNKLAIEELITHLNDKHERVSSDCLKTLYEIGEREPKLIADHVDEFATLLTSKKQRAVWGAITALDMAATANPVGVHAHLKAIVRAADGESVIARDHAVHILRKLCVVGYERECFPILLKMISDAPVNQWPTYAEQAAEVVYNKQRMKLLAEIVTSRMGSIAEHKTKTLRMQKLLRKLS